MPPTFYSFLQTAQKINAEVDGLSGCIKQAEGCTMRSHGAAGGNEQEEAASQMGRITETFREKSRGVKGMLDAMRAENEAYLADAGQDSVFPKRIAHFQSLARRFSSMVEGFKRTQVAFGTIESERLKSQYLITRPGAPEEELDALDNGEKGRGLLQSAFALGSASAQQIISHAERRHNSIQHLLGSISELGCLAQDLNDMLAFSSEHMDRVQIHVAESSRTSLHANSDLEQARVYRKRVTTLQRVWFVLAFSVSVILLFWIGGHFGAVLKAFMP